MAVAEGVKGKGAEVSVITAAEFSPEQVGEYSAIAFGCPSMGSEQLEESEFEPMFTACEGRLSGKNIGHRLQGRSPLQGLLQQLDAVPQEHPR